MFGAKNWNIYPLQPPPKPELTIRTLSPFGHERRKTLLWTEAEDEESGGIFIDQVWHTEKGVKTSLPPSGVSSLYLVWRWMLEKTKGNENWSEAPLLLLLSFRLLPAWTLVEWFIKALRTNAALKKERRDALLQKLKFHLFLEVIWGGKNVFEIEAFFSHSICGQEKNRDLESYLDTAPPLHNLQFFYG